MAMAPDSAPRTVPAWQVKLQAFWRWWTDELAQVVPERFASLRGAGRVPQLALERNEVVVVEPRGLGAAARVPLDPADPARSRGAVRALLERAGEQRGRARVALAREETLMRRVTMPAATEENLTQVLGFEMDRLTPFRAEDVYFDHRVLGRDAAAGTLSVLLVVARREVVDARVEALRALGVSVQGVTVRDEPAGGGAPIDLLPSEQRGERESAQERTVRRGLLVAVVVLLAAVLLLPVWRKRETVIALHPVVGRAAAEAQATDVLARELERMVTDYNFLLTRKHSSPPALAYVEDVSRLLPDNTWVQQLDLKAAGKGREVQITGETASSSRLIEILEQSTLLRNATPRGTVTRGSQPGTERFMIAAETQPRALPEPQPASDLLAVPDAAGATARSGLQRGSGPPGAAPPPAGGNPPVPAKVEPQPRPAAPARPAPEK